MDALTHAIEGLVCRNCSPLTDGLALSAIELIHGNLRVAFSDGVNLEARSNMMYGQATAGMAFTNAGVGNAHAMAHQLGAIFDLPHGLANAVLLPYVMEFNLPTCQDKFAKAARAMGGDELANMSKATLARLACSMVVMLNEDIGIPSNVKDLGIDEKNLAILVKQSMADGCVTLNPRQTSTQDMDELWRRAFFGERTQQTFDGVTFLNTI